MEVVKTQKLKKPFREVVDSIQQRDRMSSFDLWQGIQGDDEDDVFVMRFRNAWTFD